VDSQRLHRIAARQHGLFTRRQAQSAGFSPYQVRRRIQTGEWFTVLGQVLCLPGAQVTPTLRDRAAQLAVPGSVLAGPSAARLWGMPVPDHEPHLYVPRHANSRLAGLRLLHGVPDVRDVGWHGRTAITLRARTVYDCLRLLPALQATALLDRALQQGWIAVADLVDRIQRDTARRDLGKIVRVARGVVDGTRSAAERVTTDLLRRGGIGGWLANQPIHDGRGLIGIGDIVFEAIKLVVELDGRAFHVTPEHFQRDRRRQNRLIAAGWTVLRFTWWDLTERPDDVLAQIRAAVARLAG
jgi:very-short-patch-repair endonuclease